jgi:hypothetical protein
VDANSGAVDASSDAVDANSGAVDASSDAVDASSGAVDANSGTVDASSDAVDASSDADSGEPPVASETPPEATDAQVDLASGANDAGNAQDAAVGDAFDAARGAEAGPDGDACDAGVAAWQFLGSGLSVVSNAYAYAPALAIVDGDQPVVAWEETGTVQTCAWTDAGCGGSWTPLGAASGYCPVVAAGGTHGLLRAYTLAATTQQVVVERWNGSAFVSLGAPLGAAGGGASCPAMVADAAGNPTIVWSGGVGLASAGINVERWTGTSWISLTDDNGVPGGFVFGGIPDPLSITLLPDGTPLVAWPGLSHATMVARWISGTSWTAVGSPPPSNSGAGEDNGPIVRATSAGEVYLAWMVRTSSYHVEAAHLEAGAWTILGGPLMANGSAQHYALAFDLGGAPLVSATEGVASAKASRVVTYRWSGTTWDNPVPTLPDPANTFAHTPHLEVDSRGRWVTAWEELTPGPTGVIRVARIQP